MNKFICIHCGKEVTTTGNIGTHQRNHCPFCLYSKHVDEIVGDRKATCMGEMKPIGLTFKYAKGASGEIMLIHLCKNCGKISINRITADDDIKKIQEVFEKSLDLGEDFRQRLDENKIYLLTSNDRQELTIQLFGNNL